ncbi:MAG: MFS transporter [Saccharothrix sp.]|nr:MFS transporter [Saccharothrix sp.]
MRNKWWPLAVVSLGAFMLLVDVTIVVVALPGMSRDLGASLSGLQWVMDAYTLGLAASLLVAGSLADRFGRRATYLASLALFAAASLACGLAGDATTLVVARTVQGVAGAAMFASTMALLNLAYRGRDRAVAFAVWGAVTGAAAATGPVLGGLLAEHLGWRSVFLVNLPISVVAVVLALAVLGESRDPAARRLDLPGAAAFTLSAAALVHGLIVAGEDGWTAATTLVRLAVGLLALAVFVAVEVVTERRGGHAMLDLGLFRRPAFVGVMLAALLTSVSAFGYTAYTSLWLQSALGLGAVGAGLALLPMSGAAFLTSAVTARRLAGASPRVTITVGLALVGVGALAQAFLDGASSWTAVAPGLALSGVGIGLALPHLNATAMAAVPPTRGGMAAGALNTARQLGMALGIAALGTAFATRADFRALADRAATASGLNLALLIAGVVGLVGAVVVAVLLRPTAAEPVAVASTR